MPLVVVPTPIGNLEDMTLRGLRALRDADVIACEDTRRTLKLLNHYEISKPLVSYHKHNERIRTDELAARLINGDKIALVSDAGTPGLSDPGCELISRAISRGLPVDVLPGANAVLPALLLSGLPAQPFLFVGFLGVSDRERAKRLSELAEIEATLVIYVAPHDMPEEAEIAASVLGDRRAALVREISKVHQEAIRGNLSDIARTATEREIKGEMVLVVEGAKIPEPGEAEGPPEWLGIALRMKEEGIYDKSIANVISASYGIPRNSVKAVLKG
jgi:16S rRNA (cytidine1402-2'-O)-methyltransferase